MTRWSAPRLRLGLGAARGSSIIQRLNMCILYFKPKRGQFAFWFLLMIVQYLPSVHSCIGHIFGKLLIWPAVLCAVLYSLLLKLYLILSKSFKFYFWFWLCRFLAMAMLHQHIIKSSNDFSWARSLKTSLSPDTRQINFFNILWLAEAHIRKRSQDK